MENIGVFQLLMKLSFKSTLEFGNLNITKWPLLVIPIKQLTFKTFPPKASVRSPTISYCSKLFEHFFTKWEIIFFSKSCEKLCFWKTGDTLFGHFDPFYNIWQNSGKTKSYEKFKNQKFIHVIVNTYFKTVLFW